MLGALVLASGGCHHRGLRALDDTAVAPLYAAVLSDLQRDSASASVVLDSLVPSADLDPSMVPQFIGRHRVSRQSVNALRAAQRSRASFSVSMLPDSLWRAVSSRTLDSLRGVARANPAGRGVPTSPGADSFWRLFHRTFPRTSGYVVLSPAGISDDGREALLYVQRTCGAVCGESELWVLRRAPDGRWRTVGRTLMSIS